MISNKFLDTLAKPFFPCRNMYIVKIVSYIDTIFKSKLISKLSKLLELLNRKNQFGSYFENLKELNIYALISTHDWDVWPTSRDARTTRNSANQSDREYNGKAKRGNGSSSFWNFCKPFARGLWAIPSSIIRREYKHVFPPAMHAGERAWSALHLERIRDANDAVTLWSVPPSVDDDRVL